MKPPIPVKRTGAVSNTARPLAKPPTKSAPNKSVTIIKAKSNSGHDTLDAMDKYDAVNEQEQFLKNLDEIMSSSSHVMHDPRIDVREMAKAKNSYEFYTSKEFLNFRPYARQLELTGKLALSVCVDKSTTIVSSKGLLSIDSLVGKKLGLVDFSVSSRTGIFKVKKGGMTKSNADTLRLKILGRPDLIVTPEHLILCYTKDSQETWKQAKDLTTDDYLVYPVGRNLWPQKPTQLKRHFKPKNDGRNKHKKNFKPLVWCSSELARLTGYLLTDGWTRREHYLIGMDVTSLDMALDFKHCLEVLFDVTPAWREYFNETGKKAYNVSITNRNVYDYLAHIGYFHGKARTKKVPNYIRTTNRSQVIEFLRAAFDSDGYMYDNRVGICQKNPEIIEFYHHALMNLGIFNNYHDYVSKGEPTPRVEIRGSHYVNMFARIIGTNNEWRYASLEHNFNVLSKKIRSLYPGVVPYGADFIKKHGNYFNDKRAENIDLHMLDWINAPASLVHLCKEKIDLAYTYAPFIGSESAGKRAVYDINVPEDESFCANGAIVHNCPYCTPEFYDDPHDFKAPYQTYLRDYAYYENGVCPDCKSTRLDALLDNELDEKYIMVGIAGQRCVCTSTLAYTPSGPKPITRFKETDQDILTPHGPSTAIDYFDQGKQTVFRITTQSGRFIDVTGNHKLFFAGYGYLSLKKTHRKEIVYRRTNDLEIAPLSAQRSCSISFIEPDNDQLKIINLATNLRNSIADVIAREDLKPWQMNYPQLQRKIGRQADPDMVSGKPFFNAADITQEWIWDNTQTRDCFFLGLAHYSCTGGNIYATIPYIWINAYYAWLDELGIEGKLLTNPESTAPIILELDVVQFRDANLPLEYLFGKGNTDFIRRVVKEDTGQRSSLYYKAIGESVTALLKKFGHEKNQYAPYPMVFELDSWRNTMEIVELFRSRALDTSIRKDITQNFVDALDLLIVFMGQPSDSKKSIHASILKDIASIKDAADRLHDRRFSKVVSILNIGSVDTVDIEVENSCFIANGIHSHNSSKSRTATMIALEKMHQLLMTGNPAEYYGLLGGQTLSGIFTATAIEQAAKNMFVPGIKNMLEGEAPWFVTFNQWLKSKESVIGKKLFRIQETQCTYIFGNLWLGCLSPDIRTIRGRTGFFEAVDEAGYFDNDPDKLRAGGLEVANALMNAMQTVLNAARRLRKNGDVNAIFPAHLMISSIFSEIDPIVTWRKQQWDNPGAVHFKYPTWKFNPDFTEKQLRIDNKTDTFDRDFGSIPQKTGGSFIKMATLKAMLGDKPNGAKVTRVEYVNQKTGVIYTSGKTAFRWSVKPGGMQTLMTLDAGARDNSFSACISHVDEEDGAFIVDALVEVQPLPDRDIHFSALCYAVLGELIDAYNVKIVGSDRWNSLKLLQDMSDEYGVQTLEWQLKYKDFLAWRNDATNGMVVLPREEMDLEEAVLKTSIQEFVNMPVAHFYQQCSSVVDTGKQIEKAKHFTDDNFRSVVLGWRIAQEPEIRDIISSLDQPMVTGPLLVSSTSLGSSVSANSEILVSRGGGKDKGVDIEMRPSVRSFGGSF